jgi:uncharacterized protein YdhG (YjbR/CyaY superfamily)
MKHTDYSTVDEYIALQPKEAQRVLRRVRTAIRKAVPEAVETISYRIPAYKLRGRILIYFAGWKDHYSLYPSTAPLVRAFKKELAPYEVSGKGTVRFPLAGEVPVKLIAAMTRFRAKEVADAEKAKVARRRAR